MAFVTPVAPIVPAGLPLPLDAGAATFDGGFGKSMNLDTSGSINIPPSLLTAFIGGSPYVPTTPLGALSALKGDLMIPIVIVGVAVFLLLIIFFTIKLALGFKLKMLKGGKLRRDTSSAESGATPGPPNEMDLNELAHIVLTAIQSQTCAQNMICELGIMARDRQGLPSLLRILETLVPVSLQEPLGILRSSAEGSFKCEQKYPCAGGDKENLSSTSTTTSKPPSVPAHVSNKI